MRSILWFTFTSLPFIGTVVVYLSERWRRVPIWFDVVVIALASTWPAIVLFWPQLIASGGELLEVQEMSGLLVPFWSLVVGIPVLCVGAFLRYLLFARPYAASDV